MPHVEVKTDEKGRIVFKIKPELPVSEWKATKMTLKIKESKDVSACMGPCIACMQPSQQSYGW